jgi:L-asparaginase
MSDILVINTGGTFNKRYNRLNGELFVDDGSQAFEEITSNWLCEFEIVNIVGKDSLEFDDNDRELIKNSINQHNSKNKFIIIHGTDTIHITADFLDKNCKDKVIVLTGAMVPFSINPIEATANFAMSYGFLSNCDTSGIYICMNGKIGEFTKVKKDKIQGKFVKTN